MTALAPWLPTVNLALSLLLLIIGLSALVTRQRVIKQIIGLNIMLQGALLAIIEAGRAHGSPQLAQSLVVSALVAEVIVVAIALALIISIHRFHPHGRVDDLDRLKG